MNRLTNRVRSASGWLAVAAALSVGVGCSVDNSAPPYDEEEPHRLERDPYASRYDEPAPAPAPAPEPEPRREWEGARLRVEGRGEDLRFTAPRDGIVYIVDSRERTLLYRTQLDRGEEIVVRPYQNTIEIDGRRVKRLDVDNKHLIRIFFERD